jgi:hypothetical protein
MTDDAFPILIGITGKRNFAPDSAANDAIRARVARRLADCFAYINETLPHAPKVLLTGGAYGSDLLAARAALAAGNEWSVAIVLPYAASLFEHDFILDQNGPTCHPDHATFRALLSAKTHGSGRRVIVREMPSLMTAAGHPASDEELNKFIKHHDAILRREHYEQVGQFIAETAMLLIAVMEPDERPDLTQANGSTARVIATRRAGRPDPLGADVASRSTVVRNQWNDLLAPPGGYVWLIDPYDEAERQAPPVSVLPPLSNRTVTEVFEGRPELDMPEEPKPKAALARLVARGVEYLDDRVATLSGRLSGREPPPKRALRRESLHAAQSFDDFERFRQALGGVRGQAAVSASLDDEMDTAGYIVRLRDMIRGPQRHARQNVESALRRVVCLFVVAILGLEIYAKFYQKSPVPLLVYVAMVTAIAVIVFVTRVQLWQPRSEDYRAVSEMLRIQRAWWACGLSNRVDREGLQGVDAELARPRDAMRAVLNWTALRANWRPAKEPPLWPLVRAVRPGERPDLPRSRKVLAEEGAAVPTDWIGEQIRYFARNQEDREQTVWKNETRTWLMFAVSGSLAALVVLWLGDEAMGTATERWFDRLTENPGHGWLSHIAFLPWVMLVIAMAYLRWHLRELQGTAGVAATLIAGAFCAFGIAVILNALGGPIYFVVHEVMSQNQLSYIASSGEMTERLAVVVFVVLTAAAGAVHFHAEKRGYEAEAFAYRDALDKFERAEQVFAALVDPVSGVPVDAHVARARGLVRALGLLALRENEIWLKTHRERPLSPVVG